MIGILPAAGHATRIHGLPKYLLPVRDTYLLQWHISGMKAVGCDEVLIGIRPDNVLTILEHVQDRVVPYLALQRDTMTQTVLSTLNYRDVTGKNVLFSMPDTYWQSPNVFLPLQMALWDGADVAVAVFKIRANQKRGGMCRIEGDQVVEVIDKPDASDLEYIWGALAWKPAFWDYLDPEDPHVGYGLPRAIADHLDVRAVVCEGGYWDCGTPDEYFDCIRTITGEMGYAPA